MKSMNDLKNQASLFILNAIDMETDWIRDNELTFLTDQEREKVANLMDDLHLKIGQFLACWEGK